MKFFAVFAAVLAVTAAYSPVDKYTLKELEAAIKDPETNPNDLPYLINGMNVLMANLFTDQSQETSIILSLPYEETLTMDQLATIIHDPSTHPAALPYFEAAFEDLMVAMNNGKEEDITTVKVPAMTVTMMSLSELSSALENPETDPELMVYLEYALNQHMLYLHLGGAATQVIVVTPPGVIVTPGPEQQPEIAVLPQPEKPIKPEVVVEEPQPIVNPPKPVAPTPSAPLVQLIINVNANQQQAPIPAAVHDDIGVNPAGWAPVEVEAPVQDGPTIAVNPAGWAPVEVEAPVQDGPTIAVNPIGWAPVEVEAPVQDGPTIAVNPAGWN